MSSIVRVCTYASEAASQKELIGALAQLADVRVERQCTTLDEVRNCVAQRTADLLVFNLDPDIDESLKGVQQLVRSAPDLGLIGVSASTAPSVIIAAMRAGCAQFVCAPIEISDLESAISRVRASRAGSRPEESRRIYVMGASGGVGATTIACNLAIEIAQITGRTSALIDLNLEYGDIAAAFDCKPKYSLADVCKHGAELDPEVLEAAMSELPCNVAVLARPDQITDGYNVTPEGVAELLKVLGSTYAHVVVDVPRYYGFLSTVALPDTYRTLVVTQLSVASVRNAGRILDALRQLSIPNESVEVVVNRWKAEHDRISNDDIERQFNRRVFALIPNDYRRVSSALDFGHPIQAKAPNSPARLAIHEMAKTLVSDRATGGVESTPKGLFRKLLSRKAATSK